MPPQSFAWPISPLTENIWTVSVPVRFAATWFPHVMAVIRLSDGSLVIHSPCRLSESLRIALLALGPVKHIIAPNWFHDLYLAEYRAAFPDAVLWGPRFLQRLKGRELVGARLENAQPWDDEMLHFSVRGLLTFDEVLFFHQPSETLIVADLLMNLILHADAPPATRFALRISRADRGLCVFPLLRFAPTMRRRLEAAARQMIAWGPKQIIVGHGFPILRDAPHQLAGALEWLLPNHRET